MSKTFKKNQPIVATLPTGRVVEGIYIEPYGEDGHSFYVNEYDGKRGGKDVFKKTMYGVSSEFINAASDEEEEGDTISEKQYNAWIERSKTLQERIDNDTKEKESLCKMGADTLVQKLNKKIERNKNKLEELNAKIEEYS
jgi:hypothetical protein